MEKNKRNKIIGLSIGILIVLIIVVSSTYAYWQITKTQETPNDIVAACLNLALSDASAENRGIDLDSAWPISDEEGKNLTGYTFTVTNNCDEEINYIIGLNRVEESNYLLDSSIKLQLDDNSSHVYGDLSDVEYSDAENTEYIARVAKQVSVETIGANGTNTHTIRVWINDEAPVTEQSKTFLGQVFIIGGQGIEVPSCFTIADNGTILGYDESCGVNVRVPAEINGISVKRIDNSSFHNGDVTNIFAMNNHTEEGIDLFYLKNTDKLEAAEYMIRDQYCSDKENCNLYGDGIYFLKSLEDYNNFDWDNYTLINAITVNLIDDGKNFEYFVSDIETLDLSEAINLEVIHTNSFYNMSGAVDTPISDNCEFNGSTYYCKGNLNNIIFPENGKLETIYPGAFYENQISRIELPDSIKMIGASAFYNNSITNKVVLPSSLESIGTNSFYGNSVTEFIVKRTETDALANINFNNNWNAISGNESDNSLVFASITYNPNYTE